MHNYYVCLYAIKLNAQSKCDKYDLFRRVLSKVFKCTFYWAPDDVEIITHMCSLHVYRMPYVISDQWSSSSHSVQTIYGILLVQIACILANNLWMNERIECVCVYECVFELSSIIWIYIYVKWVQFICDRARMPHGSGGIYTRVDFMVFAIADCCYYMQ